MEIPVGIEVKVEPVEYGNASSDWDSVANTESIKTEDILVPDMKTEPADYVKDNPYPSQSDVVTENVCNTITNIKTESGIVLDNEVTNTMPVIQSVYSHSVAFDNEMNEEETKENIKMELDIKSDSSLLDLPATCQYLESDPLAIDSQQIAFINNSSLPAMDGNTTDEIAAGTYTINLSNTEPQMISFCYANGSGGLTDCSFDAVVENVTFVNDVACDEGAMGDPDVSELKDVALVVKSEVDDDSANVKPCSSVASRSKMEESPEESDSDDEEDTDSSDSSSSEEEETEQTKYVCRICGKVFSTSFYLTKHERMHGDVKPYRCNHCWRFFSTMVEFTDHVASHSAEELLYCQYCGEVFKSRWHWKEHERAHSNKKLKCDRCGRVFLNTLYLMYHRKSFHGLEMEDGKLNKCDVCRKVFQSKQALVSHKKMHDKTHECELCGKVFCYKSLLSRHKNRMHPFA